MTEFLTLGGAGFLLGFRHAFEADHLAAVTTLSTRRQGFGSAAALGALWGVGHTLAVGVAILLLSLANLELPASVQAGAELAVALLLLALGWLTLRRLRRDPEPTAHSHDPRHEHGPKHGHDHSPARPPRGPWQSFGFGLVHGLAGSGSVIVLLAATAATGREKLASFVPFGVGTVVGMLLVSVAVSQLSRAAGARSPRWSRWIEGGAAAASIVVGIWLGWETLAG